MAKYLVTYVLSQTTTMEKQETNEETAEAAVIEELAALNPGFLIDVIDVEEID